MTTIYMTTIYMTTIYMTTIYMTTQASSLSSFFSSFTWPLGRYLVPTLLFSSSARRCAMIKCCSLWWDELVGMFFWFLFCSRTYRYWSMGIEFFHPNKVLDRGLLWWKVVPNLIFINSSSSSSSFSIVLFDCFDAFETTDGAFDIMTSL